MTRMLRVLIASMFFAGVGIAFAITHSLAKTIETPADFTGARSVETAPASRIAEALPAPTPEAVVPQIEIVKYKETDDVGSNTRLAKVSFTVRVKNNHKSRTDPFTLSIKDTNRLLRQSKPIRIPSLPPGASQLRNLEMEADINSSEAQSLHATAQWRERYRARCGPEYQTVMAWSGTQGSSVPRNGHYEAGLHFEAVPDRQFQVDPNGLICDAAHCIKPCEMARDIRNRLDGHVVGYSFFVGLNPKYYAGGQARTSADGTARDFTSKTKITVASVSKIVTTIAAVRILDRNTVRLDDTIGPYLPSDWDVSSYVAGLTFEQLLSHTTGIKDYGNVNTDYAELKRFFTQPVRRAAPTTCNPKDDEGNLISVDSGEGFARNDTTRCYSNYNFSIFRILLPKVAGLEEDSDLTRRPQTLANQYQTLVRNNVFDLVGQPNVACKPPIQRVGEQNYAFAYLFPGTSPGANWGDESLKCGATSWYLSVEDLAPVLLSINARDGRIFTESAAKHPFDDMQNGHLGWDIDNNEQLEKNGGYAANCDSDNKNCALISTSAGIFGPVTGPRLVAILFLNSNISGGLSDGDKARKVLQEAYRNSLRPR